MVMCLTPPKDNIPVHVALICIKSHIDHIKIKTLKLKQKVTVYTFSLLIQYNKIDNCFNIFTYWIFQTRERRGAIKVSSSSFYLVMQVTKISSQWGWCGTSINLTGEQGWRSGESTRLPPMWPGFDSRTRRHKWAEFVLVLFSASRVFLRVLRFSPLSKNQHTADSSWL